MPKIASLVKALLEKEVERKKHKEGKTVVFADWLESGLLNDFDLNTSNFDSAEYLKLEKERIEALGKLNTLKDSLSIAEGEIKELTKTSQQGNLFYFGSGKVLEREREITRLTADKDRVEKKFT